ncbi:universal stress protein [Methanocella sp. CWC-04]|uniref:Universal stress protein n=1 Tax=Methanooceanicella nereidis TaxID=2052831 RepID=A0AAP2RBG0_9EURY|nr:universal stress protein [Methanocella sp. CWC-04]MCD1293962.1 universal stress protein [Methanocella sp. CWC-04]
MTSRILIATDGSKYSEKAVDYCIGMAQRLGSEVIALYVISMKTLEIYAMGHHDDIRGYEEANSKLRNEGEEALRYAVRKGNESGVIVNTFIARGYPGEEILKLADQERVDMIVVGSLGKSGLEHLLIGSVSEEVVKKAPCPVLVVRGNI